MIDFTLHELQCFDAVLRAGGFQAAAEYMHRSHSAVFAAVAKLERQLGLALLDRDGYRVQPTDAGRALHRKALVLLREAEALRAQAQVLAGGNEAELRIVVGDLCPRPWALRLLADFFATQPGTRLHLQYEAVAGPWERLLDDEADLIVHRIDRPDPRLEWIDLAPIALMPVAAPGFFDFDVSGGITPEQARGYIQCVLRDTARHSPDRDHYLVEGAPQCSVADHAMKKELILHGMAWGHLPRFLVEQELSEGLLLPLVGTHFPGVVETLVAARRRDRSHGPVADCTRRSHPVRRRKLCRSRRRKPEHAAMPARRCRRLRIALPHAHGRVLEAYG